MARWCWEGAAPSGIAEEGDGWLSAHWDHLEGGEFFATLSLNLPEVIGAPFWCIPGLFWGDNRDDSTGQYFQRYDRRARPPGKFVSDLWEFHIWRTVQPLVACHDGENWWILEVAPHMQVAQVEQSEGSGLFPVSIGFEGADGGTRLLASLPPRERPYRPTGTEQTFAKHEKLTLPARAKIFWKFRFVRLAGGQRTLLSFLKLRYHESAEPVEIAHGSGGKNRAIVNATRDALLHWHYDSRLRFFRYTVSFDRCAQQIAELSGGSIDRLEMAIGWASGWVVFEALLREHAALGTRASRDAVCDVWGALQQQELVSPSGYWWTRFRPTGESYRFLRAGDGTEVRVFDANWMPAPGNLHLRTLGDAVRRACRALRESGGSLPFARELAGQCVRQAEMVAGLARSDGWPLPMCVDPVTGRPGAQRGSAAMIWLSVWSELHLLGLWDDLEILRQGADVYRRSVEVGELFGAPEDVGECMSSEDVYLAVNAYMDVARVTRSSGDLETAALAAEWLYLWRKSFSHVMDPRTTLGVYKLKSRGGDVASFKNQHLHVYGLDVEDSLLELSRVTNDDCWRSLADDHYTFASQLVPLVDGQFNGYRGMVAEQFYFVDWSPFGNSVALFEEDDRSSEFSCGPHHRNNGNVSGFSHAWCTSFVLAAACRRCSS